MLQEEGNQKVQENNCANVPAAAETRPMNPCRVGVCPDIFRASLSLVVISHRSVARKVFFSTTERNLILRATTRTHLHATQECARESV